MKRLKKWAQYFAIKTTGLIGIVSGFIVLTHGDQITPIFMLIPGAILLAIPAEG